MDGDKSSEDGENAFSHSEKVEYSPSAASTVVSRIVHFAQVTFTRQVYHSSSRGADVSGRHLPIPKDYADAFQAFC